jgi:hypothetical protein
MSNLLTAGGANGPLSAGGLFTPAAVQTSAYSANPGDFVPVDTTGGAVTVTLPTAPADGTTVVVKMIKQGSTNAVTIACGGADVINAAGGSTSGTLSLLNQGLILQYKASTSIWYVLDALGLGQLDSRYQQSAGGVLKGAFAPTVVALTDGASIAVNAALGNDFRVTIAGNRTIAAPTNPTDGQVICFQITQDATGSRTLTWTSTAGGFDFGTAGAPTLTTTAAKTDLLRFRYNATASKWYYDGDILGL